MWKANSMGWLSRLEAKDHDILPAGMYSPYFSSQDGKWYHSPKSYSTDDLLHLPGLPIDFILGEMKTFWSKKDEFKKFGFLQKRGIMLYGPPGCGKSSIVALVREQVLKMGGVCFVMNSNFSELSAGIADFRKAEPERPVMTLVEDIETVLETSNTNNNAVNEKSALAFYDGEAQINNIVHIATTNKPELIADRFIRRPGRFDLVVGIHAPGRNTREEYLKHICNGEITEKQREDILDQTEGLSLAYMREIAVTYLVLEIPLEQTIKRLRDQNKAKYGGNKTGFTIGFTEQS